MFYDNITAVKILHLIGHFAYLIKTIPEFDVGTKFEFNCPLNERLVCQFNDLTALQDILDCSDINFDRNILSVKTRKGVDFARIVFNDKFTIKDLIDLYPKLKLPTCDLCGNSHYHIPGSGICYAKDFNYRIKMNSCD